jgi:sugar O-acyltransferase (sialic acid O-acetyltransferase NeuD family)
LARREPKDDDSARSSRVVVLGAGGHGVVVADILLRAQMHEPVGFLDDDDALRGTQILGLPVLGGLQGLPTIEHDLIVLAIGDNKARADLFSTLQEQGERFAIAVHPSAVVAPDVQIGEGSVIVAGAVVNPGTVIGQNVIVNTAASIDHHGSIGSHVHIGPGAHLGGTVHVGEGTFIGMGATVVPGVRIDAWRFIKAHSLVAEDLP